LTGPGPGVTILYRKRLEECPMQDSGKRHNLEHGERKAIVLEFVAASAIFTLLLVVLYMVFAYKPV